MDAFRDALMDCGLENLGFLEMLSPGREGE
jgi:hypothetical protein